MVFALRWRVWQYSSLWTPNVFRDENCEKERRGKERRRKERRGKEMGRRGKEKSR